MKEWKEGVRYAFSNKQTVPLEQLEKDLQEGVQFPSTASQKSDKEPWRQGITNRNVVRDRKIVIYGMLQAEREGHKLKELMAGHVKAAEQAIQEASKRQGASTTVLTYIQRRFESDPKFMSPTEFEEKVLGWKLTADNLVNHLQPSICQLEELKKGMIFCRVYCDLLCTTPNFLCTNGWICPRRK